MDADRSKRWRWWYIVSLVIWCVLWLLMVFVVQFIPDPTQATDVMLLPLLFLNHMPIIIIIQLIACVIIAQRFYRHRRAICGVVVILATFFGLALTGEWIFHESQWTVQNVGTRTEVVYRETIVSLYAGQTRITYVCDDWLLSCDVLARQWEDF